MAGVSSCMKYSMFFFNFIFWLCGAIVLGVSIWIRVSKNAQEIEASLNQTLQESVKSLQSTSEDSKAIREKFQEFEETSHCCGLLNGPKDWGNNFYVPLGGKKVCECDSEDSSTDLCTYYQDRYIYKKTCGEVIIKYLKDHLLIIMGIAFGLAVVEILGLGFSMSLYCQIGRK
ncbi:tetraspanin-8 [Melanerpes formicivorus]|uniref:tetraspanin-8 n=1 Tax=Melanerpes formicivorus TaxID=211600 RepID=UPI00358F5814